MISSCKNLINGALASSLCLSILEIYFESSFHSSALGVDDRVRRPVHLPCYIPRFNHPNLHLKKSM